MENNPPKKNAEKSVEISFLSFLSPFFGAPVYMCVAVGMCGASNLSLDFENYVSPIIIFAESVCGGGDNGRKLSPANGPGGRG